MSCQVRVVDSGAVQEAVAALLELTPVLLAAAAHFPATTPLHRFWCSPVAQDGLNPAMLLATYVAHPYGKVGFGPFGYQYSSGRVAALISLSAKYAKVRCRCMNERN